MTNQVVRRHEMFLRVREFGAARAALFTPGAPAPPPPAPAAQ